MSSVRTFDSYAFHDFMPFVLHMILCVKKIRAFNITNRAAKHAPANFL